MKDKGGAQRKRARISGAKSGAGDEGESQSIVDEAGNDAAAEMTMADENAGGDASGGGASGGGSGGASEGLPAGLLARRLDKSKSENVQLAARVAELEEQLASEKASQNSPRPAPAPKVLKLITLKFISRHFFRDKMYAKICSSVHCGQGSQDASNVIQDPDRCSGRQLGRLCDPTDPLPPAPTFSFDS